MSLSYNNLRALIFPNPHLLFPHYLKICVVKKTKLPSQLLLFPSSFLPIITVHLPGNAYQSESKRLRKLRQPTRFRDRRWWLQRQLNPEQQSLTKKKGGHYHHHQKSSPSTLSILAFETAKTMSRPISSLFTTPLPTIKSSSTEKRSWDLKVSPTWTPKTKAFFSTLLAMRDSRISIKLPSPSLD